MPSWLASQGLDAGDLSAEVVERFVVSRRSRCRSMRSARALLPLLGFLRGVGVAPMPVPATPAGPVEEIIARFAEHLRAGRGLADATVVSYVSQAAVFLRWRVERYGADWGSLTAMQVHEYVGSGPGAAAQVGRMWRVGPRLGWPSRLTCWPATRTASRCRRSDRWCGRHRAHGRGDLSAAGPWGCGLLRWRDRVGRPGRRLRLQPGGGP